MAKLLCSQVAYGVAIVWALAGWTPPAFADELELTNGTVYKGRLVSRSEAEITFEAEMDSGAKVSVTLPSIMVQKLRLDPNAPPAGNTAAAQPAWKSGKLDTTPRADVERLISAASGRDPKLPQDRPIFPDTLDLTWAAHDNSQQDLDKYLTDEIYPQSAKWPAGLLVLHHVMDKAPTAAVKARTATALGDAYLHLRCDYARAAYWYRQAGGNDRRVELATCYWKLGSVSLAGQTLTQPPASPVQPGAIRLWAQMGELDQAIKLADQLAAEGNADTAWLAAGDGCRFAGQYRRAVTYYRKVNDVASGSAQLADNKRLANESAAALKDLEGLAISRIPDGKYAASSDGYAGPVTVEIVITAGKIESAAVGENQETRTFTSLTDISKAIVARQGIVGVDCITGATVTSSAILNAASKALVAAMPAPPPPPPPPVVKPPDVPVKPVEPKPAGKYADGVYTGSFRGYKSDIGLRITVRNSRIATIEVNQNETPAYWNRAKVVIGRIIQRQGTAGVDTVTRATLSSRAIINAANQALDKAKNDKD